ncbi:hypothetical protein [Ornithinimicrobium cryptoxanthini]|uniref:Uncharacterized protein n=1 Tax=Ornithinimicrobium cryptoxanthini TaxID=2934161 RepID=A0ABY4YMM5_9MICO|nr:hypothetical protein [Ornithinimicrobium cryptoxanthini]USQ77852.1 hypothetical protein NF557_08170 [Ornithinimicrobium cryptoxanthini]
MLEHHDGGETARLDLFPDERYVVLVEQSRGGTDEEVQFRGCHADGLLDVDEADVSLLARADQFQVQDMDDVATDQILQHLEALGGKFSARELDDDHVDWCETVLRGDSHGLISPSQSGSGPRSCPRE